MRYEGALRFSEKLESLKNLQTFVLDLDKVDIDNNGKLGSIAIFDNLKFITKLEKFHLSYEEFKKSEF